MAETSDISKYFNIENFKLILLMAIFINLPPDKDKDWMYIIEGCIAITCSVFVFFIICYFVIKIEDMIKKRRAAREGKDVKKTLIQWLKKYNYQYNQELMTEEEFNSKLREGIIEFEKTKS